MNTAFSTIQDAVAEIESLCREGYCSFKLYKSNGQWHVEAK